MRGGFEDNETVKCAFAFLRIGQAQSYCVIVFLGAFL